MAIMKMKMKMKININNTYVGWYYDYKKTPRSESKNKMHAAWHLTRMQDWCILKNLKKRIKKMYTQEENPAW